MSSKLPLIALALLVLVSAAIAAPSLITKRRSGVYVLTTSPQEIGQSQYRVDYILRNDADSTHDAFCGYDPNTVSATPGPDSGDKLKPGEGIYVCNYADVPVYCISLGTARVSINEGFTVVPTPTP